MNVSSSTCCFPKRQATLGSQGRLHPAISSFVYENTRFVHFNQATLCNTSMLCYTSTRSQAPGHALTSFKAPQHTLEYILFPSSSFKAPQHTLEYILFPS